MVCTKCGAELKESDLFCLHCGKEVQIVPDYNPVEEIVIQNIAQAQQSEIISDSTGVTKEIVPIKPSQKDKETDLHKKKTKKKRKITFSKVFIGVMILTVIIAVTAFSLWARHKNSFEYQYHLAEKCVEEEDYQGACIYLEKALFIKSSDMNARLLMAEAYIGLNEIENAIDCLKEALKFDPENGKVAKQLIEIYSDYNYMDELNGFVTDLKGSNLAEALGDFYENRPVFSVEGGTYDKYISVELTSKGKGEIYYTVDGTKPTKQANIYSGQIRLRSGSTTVRAIFIGENGSYSIENIQKYTVNSTVPDNPIINLASGTYTLPAAISIIVPENCKVYYTLDGSTPTEESMPYTRALDMPLGQSTISAVAIDGNGIESNTIKGSYNLQLDAIFTVDQAYDILIQRLGDELVDERGAFSLECHAAIEIGGYSLYAFEKVYGTDSNGNKIYGKDKYAFDVQTAETFHAVVNPANGYDLEPF
ncbi:chitobiase/beta-hexosaminidase C-terminal domain-containing protein [Konateibacter massiliensis]|uniref:chitobiase/beta-hexosaminidase C-terminal domain-containing protein n=1 Tax=Konateibacter massiliensis TaxID=2002841 RepID=UPI000C15D1BF|nr:chitobiase/beta-hexosaminidase C-terminal domain-containing protein [Konateibacter massiliensis]